MSRVTTETGVANLTASLLKIDAVSSIDPPDQKSKFAKAANRWFDETRREVLADHIWNFAEKQDTVSKANADELEGRYTNKFLIPSDYIRIAWIGDEEYPETDYKIKDGYIYCNRASPLTFGYIYDHEDITKWSPKFVQAMARKLAANTAYEMTGNRTYAGELEKLYQDYLSTGMTIDAQESPPTHKIQRSKWKAAKEGRAGLGGVYQGRVVT